MNALLITIDWLLEEAVSVTGTISQEFGCTNIPCTYPEKVLVAWPREGVDISGNKSIQFVV